MIVVVVDSEMGGEESCLLEQLTHDLVCVLCSIVLFKEFSL
jgi:hypothetical protein